MGIVAPMPSSLRESWTKACRRPQRLLHNSLEEQAFFEFVGAVLPAIAFLVAIDRIARVKKESVDFTRSEHHARRCTIHC